MKKAFLITSFLLGIIRCNGQYWTWDDFCPNRNNLFPINIQALEYYREGYISMLDNHYPSAIRAFSKAIKCDTACLPAYVSRGTARYCVKDFSGAVEDFTKAVALDPYNYNYYEKRAYARFQLRDFKGAVDDLTKALDSNLENPEAYNLRGEANYYLGLYNETIKDCSKVIKSLSGTKEQKGRAFRFRGIARINLGQSTNGCLDLRKALKLGDQLAIDLVDMLCG